MVLCISDDTIDLVSLLFTTKWYRSCTSSMGYGATSVLFNEKESSIFKKSKIIIIINETTALFSRPVLSIHYITKSHLLNDFDNTAKKVPPLINKPFTQ